MIAQYLSVDNQLLDQLKQADDSQRTDLLEQLSQQANAQLVDLGKLWDVIHFVLTKQPATRPVPDNPLSELIVGVDTFSDDEDADFIAYTPWSHITEILAAIEQVNFAKRLEKLNMKTLREQHIFPEGIWQDKKQRLDKELLASFVELKDFYTETLDSGNNVIVSIL